ncbi:MAG: beta-ketoacyl-[acyl-carrier-protein] synthase family protein [PVC group bacterium]|nr:beta-ketoacyl-[acyl-carrier-protein] synthase family protein [PVC group bacterium]
MNKKRRVVATGLGVISSVGIGKDAFWKSVTSGTSGITEITSVDTTEFNCHYGGEVKKFNPEEFIPKRKVPFLGKTSQLALSAASLALKDAGFSEKKVPSQKFGVIIGTTVGERPLEELVQAWARGGLKEVDRGRVFQASVNNISANVGIHFKAMGLNHVFPTACAAGNYCIGYGMDLIQSGDLNFVLVGGAEAFSRVAYVGFQRLYAMSPDKCRPFDKNRKGMQLGEGSGVLLLESMESAIKRKAHIYAEVLGYGLSCDAYHATAPDTQGIAKAMGKALKDADTLPEDIDYICTHGTGTPMNDRIETAAIKEVFKDKSKDLVINSLKSMLGHTMGAASAIEAAACCMALEDGIIPPTINYDESDPECDLDCVPNKAKKKKIKVALNNGFAFGGNNCSVVFGK